MLLTDLPVVCLLSVIYCPSSVKFCFKLLLLFQFLFDHSDLFLLEKLGIWYHPVTSQNFKGSLRIPGIPRIPDFLKTLLLLQFLFDHSEFFTRKTRHIVPPCNKDRIFKFLPRIPDFFEMLLLQLLFDHSEYCTRKARHIVPPCNKAGI